MAEACVYDEYWLPGVLYLPYHTYGISDKDNRLCNIILLLSITPEL